MSAPMSDSSSSEDENAARLREAVVDSYAMTAKSVEEDKPKLPSLRPSHIDQEDENNALQTTPGFRTHVAKKLTQIIDSQLQEVDISCTCPTTESTQSEGIRLFSKSTKFVAIDEEIKRRPDKRKHPVVPSSSSDDSSDDERLAEASVSYTAIQEMSRAQNYDKKSNSDVTISGDGVKRDKSQKDESSAKSGLISDKISCENHQTHKKKKKQNSERENKGQGA